MQRAAEFAINLTANVLLNLSKLDINLIYPQNARMIFFVDFEQVVYKYFLVKNLCFTFCSRGVLHFFTRAAS